MDVKVKQAGVHARVKDTYFGIVYSACLHYGRITTQSQEEGRVLTHDVWTMDIYNMLLEVLKIEILKDDEQVCNEEGIFIQQKAD